MHTFLFTAKINWYFKIIIYCQISNKKGWKFLPLPHTEFEQGIFWVDSLGWFYITREEPGLHWQPILNFKNKDVKETLETIPEMEIKEKKKHWQTLKPVFMSLRCYKGRRILNNTKLFWYCHALWCCGAYFIFFITELRSGSV